MCPVPRAAVAARSNFKRAPATGAIASEALSA
jgi:hypothetical protein